MSQAPYQPLARRWRPNTFASVVGQHVPLSILKNALEAQKVPHALLFHGLHGTGKTTLARITSKALNCLSPTSPHEPCNNCESCSLIDGDAHPDVREVDAASRTGVDDTREMLESLPYQPVLSAYKVYIIDEVHMLSKSAFNALLKSLEEPPSHVKFIFATTELYKVPATTLSRCLILDLAPITRQKLEEHLGSIAKTEKVDIDQDALSLLSEHTNGSARDAVMAFEKVMHFSGKKKITAEIVQNAMGVISLKSAYVLLEFVLSGSSDDTRSHVASFYKKGITPQTIISSLMNALYLLICALKSPDEYAHMQTMVDECVKGKKDKVTLPFLLFVWQIMLRIKEEVDFSANAQNALDIGLLRFDDAILLQEAVAAPALPSTEEKATAVLKAIKKAFPDTEIIMKK